MPREIRSSPPIISQGTTPYIVMIVAALAFLLFQGLGSCSPGTPTLITVTPEVTFPPASQEAITVYFTNPSGQPTSLESAVVQSINNATTSLDIAMYNFSLDSVCQAVITATQRGVKVRMATDSNSLDGGCFDDLKAAGVGVLGDRREGLMHNKFLVIDGSEVWTGSLNLSNGLYTDNNNFVRIVSSRVAQNYTTEFNEMYEEDLFGPDTRANTPNPRLTINGIDVEVYFSPDDGVNNRLKELVAGADSTIDFLAYSFTLDDLAETMLLRSRHGVRVRGVFDQSQVESNGSASEYWPLSEAGLDVRQDGNPGLMHHKVILLDQQIVIFGSFNFSRNADRINDENVIIVHSPELAAQFLEEFEKIYAQAGK